MGMTTNCMGTKLMERYGGVRAETLRAPGGARADGHRATGKPAVFVSADLSTGTPLAGTC